MVCIYLQGVLSYDKTFQKIKVFKFYVNFILINRLILVKDWGPMNVRSLKINDIAVSS